LPAQWTLRRARDVYDQPFSDLLYEAQRVHRQQFDANTIQLSTLLSVKTGGCPEDCGYCSQSIHYDTGVRATRLMQQGAVVEAARAAKAAGATRFCMGAAWRGPNPRDLDRVCDMIAAVKALGLETCATLGRLQQGQAAQLRAAGLDYYSHNVDTSPRFYGAIISTRTLQDRLDTLESVREAGMRVCCGGIVGMGEQVDDRLDMLVLLANMPQQPESVPLNLWNEVAGVPVREHAERPDAISFVRLVASARIMLPGSMLRIAAGRQYMSDEAQALCFVAGANSIFLGETLLTTRNSDEATDLGLLQRLGIRVQEHPSESC
jgi:biotin synthase